MKLDEFNLIKNSRVFDPNIFLFETDVKYTEEN